MEAMRIKKILCYSGGKDSTAMLLYLQSIKAQINEILYVDCGDWIWGSSKQHIKNVEDKCGVEITVLDVEDELHEGFKKWGFPSFFNRWCTGIKREAMKHHIKENYRERERESIVQYIGYCADEDKRTSKKLYSSFDVEYPLVDAGITTSDALQLCLDNGFDFGGVYEHHSHYNCWLCPLQRKHELHSIFKLYPDKWEKLREMQHQTDGYYNNRKTIFDYEKDFWEMECESLRENRMNARKQQ